MNRKNGLVFTTFEQLESRQLFCVSHAAASLEPLSAEPQPALAEEAAATSYRINFQPDGVPVPDFHRADIGAKYGVRANGLTYGWSAENYVNARDRNAALSTDQRYDTLNHMQKGGSLKWEIAVPNGYYSVKVVSGDADYFDGVFKTNVEGKLTVNGTPSSSNRWISGTSIVNVTDGRLTVSNATGAVNNKINFIEITSTSAPTTLGTLSWKTAASHIPRTEVMSAMVNNKLYLLGGYINNSYLSVARLDVYDPANNKWTRLPDMPQALSHSGVAADDRYIYLAGGYTVNSTNTKQVFGLTSVRRYDTVTGAWTNLKSLPSPRGGGSMALVGRTLYFIAGSDDKRVDHAQMWSLNLDDSNANWVTKASLPEKNNHLGTVVLDGQIYVIGGQTGQDETAIFKKTSYRYNPSTNTWTQIASFSDPPRSHTWATTVAYKGQIILLGGEAAGKEPGRPTSVASNEIYNPQSNSWSKLSNLPGGRSSGAAGVWGEKLIFTVGLSFGTFKADTYIGEFIK